MSERQASARSCAMPSFRNQNRPDEPIGPVEDSSRQIHLDLHREHVEVEKQEEAVSCKLQSDPGGSPSAPGR